MLNFRQQDSECLVTPEAVVQITRKLRKRRAENGQKRPAVYSGSLGCCLAESGISTLGSFLETQM